MTLEQMIDVINEVRESSCMRDGMDNDYADKIIAALKHAQSLHDSLHLHMSTDVHGERQYMAMEIVDNIQASQSYLAWRKLTEEV